MNRTKVESFEAFVANMRRSANSLAMYLGGMSRTKITGLRKRSSRPSIDEVGKGCVGRAL